MHNAKIEQVTILDASAHVVWESLTRVELMKEWMSDAGMALEIETDWTVGMPIVISRSSNTCNFIGAERCPS